MHVRVLFLRYHRVRLAVGELRVRTWLVRSLRVQPELERRQARRGSVAAMLIDGRGFSSLAELFGARLVRLGKRGFILSGTEELLEHRKRMRYLQAWWCVGDAFAHDAPVVDEDEQYELARLSRNP